MGPTRKVLIIDDNLFDVMDVEGPLKAAGYSVATLSSPNGVLSKIDYEQPEIVLMDLQMPRLRLDDLVETLRNQPEYSGMALVLFSDMEAETLQQYCLDHDVNGYFSKSMDPGDIAGFLDQFYET